MDWRKHTIKFGEFSAGKPLFLTRAIIHIEFYLIEASFSLLQLWLSKREYEECGAVLSLQRFKN